MCSSWRPGNTTSYTFLYTSPSTPTRITKKNKCKIMQYIENNILLNMVQTNLLQIVKKK